MTTPTDSIAATVGSLRDRAYPPNGELARDCNEVNIPEESMENQADTPGLVDQSDMNPVGKPVAGAFTALGKLLDRMLA